MQYQLMSMMRPFLKLSIDFLQKNPSHWLGFSKGYYWQLKAEINS